MIALECYRLPVSLDDDSWQPEISAIHHRHLAQWALHPLLQQTGCGKSLTPRAEAALAEFTRVFRTAARSRNAA